ncbi:hypothetical protein HNQ40_003345 [Algisphaera agarilytica]|uniref:Uncharacterized protein n=1 Tax=Algisphaera agarilytica TaxID=1385975 RepID=A0A7X0H923_9BACT|nr:hypothetical protein [Algisphaera agarilytica]
MSRFSKQSLYFFKYLLNKELRRLFVAVQCGCNERGMLPHTPNAKGDHHGNRNEEDDRSDHNRE